jgi:hypothetical protein
VPQLQNQRGSGGVPQLQNQTGVPPKKNARLASRTVSRVLYSDESERRPSIWDSDCSEPLATNPRAGRAPVPSYLVLLRVGFAQPAGRPARWCALTAPFHPYLVAGDTPDPAKGPYGAPGLTSGLSLWHFPSRRHAWTLSSTLPVWSSDFPPPDESEGGRPSSWLPPLYRESTGLLASSGNSDTLTSGPGKVYATGLGGASPRVGVCLVLQDFKINVRKLKGPV